MKQLCMLLSLGMTALALTVSCGSDKAASTADSGASNPPDNSPLCDQVSGSDVSTTLGISGFQDAELQDSMGCSCTTCKYDGPGSSYLSIIYHPSVSRSEFDAGRQNANNVYPQYGTQDAPGIGDTAYTISISSGGSSALNSVFFLKGSIQVVITTSSTATIDQVKQLAVLVAGKL
jgi:hypothetical protein